MVCMFSDQAPVILSSSFLKVNTLFLGLIYVQLSTQYELNLTKIFPPPPKSVISIPMFSA